MRMRKVYGESKTDHCVICGKNALALNEQGFTVCTTHKNHILPELKCLCGEYLMMLDGKFGKFFQCINCGNINLKRALEINEELIQKANNNRSNTENRSNNIRSEISSKYAPNTNNNNNNTNNISKNTTIRSDDPDYFD